MELRQLQHFVAVAEEEHFTRAAQRINIVQSALSSSIRALEAELDARLFVRTTRQVRLTAAGKVFLEKAKTALDAVCEAREAVSAVASLKRGTIGIGTVQTLPPFLDLPALLALFHSQHPSIEVRLCQGSSSLLVDKVRAGQLDFAILPLCEPPADIATKMIACDALVLICPPGHALAGSSNVTLAAIADEPFVDFEQTWGTRRLIDRGFAEAGVERRTAFEVSDLDTLLNSGCPWPGCCACSRGCCRGVAVIASDRPVGGAGDMLGACRCPRYTGKTSKQCAGRCPQSVSGVVDGAAPMVLPERCQ